MKLKDKVAVVTGGGSGIGRAICQSFVREGAAVVVVDQDAEGAEKVKQELINAGGKASVFVGDVQRPETNRDMVAHAVKTFGGLDISSTMPLRCCSGAWSRCRTTNGTT
jgi:NAD(P)-dependent dehydrogenase (short-subunit alcohol dehydrogenase family)